LPAFLQHSELSHSSFSKNSPIGRPDDWAKQRELPFVAADSDDLVKSIKSDLMP